MLLYYQSRTSGVSPGDVTWLNLAIRRTDRSQAICVAPARPIVRTIKPHLCFTHLYQVFLNYNGYCALPLLYCFSLSLCGGSELAPGSTELSRNILRTHLRSVCTKISFGGTCTRKYSLVRLIRNFLKSCEKTFWFELIR